MNLKSLSDSNLLVETQRLVTVERQTTLTLLYHFQEIERRRLHLERGFSSLHEFAVKFLKYSDGAAHRRIAASRLLGDVPAVKKQFESGALSLSVAAQAQNFFRNERIHEVHEKTEVLEKLENKSLREAQRELLRISPESLPKERERLLTPETLELKLIINDKLKQKMTHLKNLLSHKQSRMSNAELLEILVDRVTAQLEKRPRSASAQKLEPNTGMPEIRMPPTQILGRNSRPRDSEDRNSQTRDPQTRDPISTNPRSAGVAVKYWVRSRDLNQCTYVDTLTGRRCSSQYKLEFDHTVPFAKGGVTQLDNLRLLCKAHNQLLAVHAFGQEKMGLYFKPKPPALNSVGKK